MRHASLIGFLATLMLAGAALAREPVDRDLRADVHDHRGQIANADEAEAQAQGAARAACENEDKKREGERNEEGEAKAVDCDREPRSERSADGGDR